MPETRTVPCVFILDDNPDLLAFVEVTLGAGGFAVESFTRPAALLERLTARQLTASRPDVILVDIRMPGMNGHQVFREIRERDKNIPIIVISASEKQEDAIEALRLRAFDFLRKPLHDFILVNAIRRALALDAANAPSTLAAPVAVEALRNERLLDVLLADDSESNRILISAYLRNAPYRLVLAKNGAEALSRFEAGFFHVVLMDMKMPDMDGLTATRGLRAIEKRLGRGRTPIIALTANAFAEHVQASLAAGCDAHLTKPIMRETLLAQISEVTKGAAAARALEIPPAPESSALSSDLLFLYIESLRLDLKLLQDALVAGDFGATGEIGHNIRGTGTSYGFERLTELGAKIEHASETGESAAVRSASEDVSTFLSNLSPCPASQGEGAMRDEASGSGPS